MQIEGTLLWKTTYQHALQNGLDGGSWVWISMYYLQYILHHMKNVIADNEYLQNNQQNLQLQQWMR